VTGPLPPSPKIYHITHVENLQSIVSDGALWCDAEVVRRSAGGTTIGMGKIKRRRLSDLTVPSHFGLHVGDCVPFYFCPRSVMLYLIHRGNHEDLSYRDGQAPIVHLEADLREAVGWAEGQGLRWAFTLSNAGAYYFESRCDLAHLGEIDWPAVRATQWKECKEGKQAEFLVEARFPWDLVRRVGVLSRETYDLTSKALRSAPHRPPVEILPSWYY
jgi:hypothetical protein